MVVLARFEFLQQRAAAGDLIAMSFLPNGVSGKVKVKILVRSSPSLPSEVIRSLSYSVLEFVKHTIIPYSVVDRGHKHSDGTYEIGVWVADALCHSATSDPCTTTGVILDAAKDTDANHSAAKVAGVSHCVAIDAGVNHGAVLQDARVNNGGDDVDAVNSNDAEEGDLVEGSMMPLTPADDGASADAAGSFQSGTVRLWDNFAGSGYISPDDGGTDVFVQRSALYDGSGVSDGLALEQAAFVSFISGMVNGRAQAICCVGASGGPPSAAHVAQEAVSGGNGMDATSSQGDAVTQATPVKCTMCKDSGKTGFSVCSWCLPLS